MKLKKAFLTSAIALLLSSNVHATLGAETVTFDDIVVGTPFYFYDSNDPDTNPDVVFSTTHPDGFNASGPGLDQLYVDEPSLEGATGTNPDLRVDFLQGAVGQVEFGFALIEQGNVTFTAYNAAGVAVGTNTVTSSCFDLDTGADLGAGSCFGGFEEGIPVGTSGFPEGRVIVPLSGQAVYGEFDMQITGFSDLPTIASSSPAVAEIDGRHVIDNFTFTPASEDNINEFAGALPDDPLFGEVTTGPDGLPTFTFDVPVIEDGLGGLFPIFIDPIYAVGYDYTTSGGNFASVLIPAALPNGDGEFTLIVGGNSYALLAGIPFDLLALDPAGFDSFRIIDIDISEMLDPTDGLAFVTGLTYVPGTNLSSTTMTPIVEETGVAVPVGSPLLLLLSGLGLLAVTSRRKAN